MRASSSAISFIAHVALAAALVLGGAEAHPGTPPPRQINVVFPPANTENLLAGIPTVRIPEIDARIDPSQIATSITTLQNATNPPPAPGTTPARIAPSLGVGADPSVAVTHSPPDVLAGPLPAYPELLRQAGIAGRVVLEGIVDTTGRIQPASITVVTATHSGFVAPARQALLATLFRPARIGGRAVQVAVRVPYEFSLRGTAHAR